MKKILALIILGILNQPVWATEQTVTLAIKNMTCAICPITVKKSLQKVQGVNAVEISFAKKIATITYDAKKISTDDLVRATTNAGYPAFVKANGTEFINYSTFGHSHHK